MLYERGVVRGVRDDAVVQLVFGRAGRGDAGEGSALAQACEHTRSADAKTNVCARLGVNLYSRSLETPFLLVHVLVDGENPRLGCRTFAFTFALFLVILLRLRGGGALAIRVSGESTAAVDEILELAGSLERSWADLPPRTKEMASIRLDLPAPLGPIMEVKLRKGPMTSWPRYDLKSQTSMRMSGIGGGEREGRQRGRRYRGFGLQRDNEQLCGLGGRPAWTKRCQENHIPGQGSPSSSEEDQCPASPSTLR